MLILVTSLACSATLSSHDCTAGNYRLLVIVNLIYHGLRTPNEVINQKYQQNWADVADKICFGHT